MNKLLIILKVFLCGLILILIFYHSLLAQKVEVKIEDGIPVVYNHEAALKECELALESALSKQTGSDHDYKEPHYTLGDWFRWQIIKSQKPKKLLMSSDNSSRQGYTKNPYGCIITYWAE